MLKGRRERALKVVAACLVVVGGVVAVPSAHAGAGDLDAAFGHGGKSIAPGLPGAQAADVGTDGKVLTAAATYLPRAGLDTGLPVAARYSAAGHLETSFGDGGQAQLPIAQSFAAYEARPTTTRILDGGASEIVVNVRRLEAVPDPDETTVVRLHPDGSLDSSFGGGDGVVGLETPASAVAVDGQGRIIYIGSDAQVHRLKADGTPDSSFAGGGAPLPPAVDEAEVLALFDDGSVLVGSSTQETLAKFTGAGALASGYGAGGVAALASPSTERLSLFTAADGSAFVLRTRSGNVGLVRLSPAGSPDPSFAEGVSLFGPGSVEIGELSPIDIAVDPGGRPLVLSLFGSGGLDVHRLSLDGKIDADFGIRGRSTVFFGLRDSGPTDLTIGPGQRIMLAGAVFRDRKHVRGQGLAALHGDGGPSSDLDADGFRNGRDNCIAGASTKHQGCLEPARTLTARVKGRFTIKGTFASASSLCMNEAGLFRKREGRDQRIGKIRAKDGHLRVRWRFEGLRSGSYYAAARQRVVDDRLSCVKLRTRALRLR
jgi:uncharacterized delta-60 repeat protein